MVRNAFCEQCGSELQNGQAFCTSCGAKGGDVESAREYRRRIVDQDPSFTPRVGSRQFRSNVSPGALFVLFAILKWISLGLGILLVVVITSEAENYMQETTAASIGCFCVLLAVFFHLEQHKS